MGKYDDILIISDVDGTFLAGMNGIPQRNTDAIEEFLAQGGNFTFATGRMHLNLINAIPNAASLANMPGVMANGTYLYDFKTDTVVSERLMEPEITLEAMRFSKKEYPDVGIRLTTKKGFVTDALEGFIAKDLTRAHLAGMINVIPIAEWDCKDCYKIVLRAEAERVDELRRALEAKYGDAFEYNKSASDYFELQRKGATKAAMLGELREIYKKRTGRALTVYACGDYENDILMLKAADVSVCPQNATPEVKCICDYCLCSCNDGLIGDLFEMIKRASC